MSRENASGSSDFAHSEDFCNYFRAPLVEGRASSNDLEGMLLHAKICQSCSTFVLRHFGLTKDTGATNE